MSRFELHMSPTAHACFVRHVVEDTTPCMNDEEEWVVEAVPVEEPGDWDVHTCMLGVKVVSPPCFVGSDREKLCYPQPFGQSVLSSARPSKFFFRPAVQVFLPSDPL